MIQIKNQSHLNLGFADMCVIKYMGNPAIWTSCIFCNQTAEFQLDDVNDTSLFILTLSLFTLQISSAYWCDFLSTQSFWNLIYFDNIIEYSHSKYHTIS